MGVAVGAQRARASLDMEIRRCIVTGGGVGCRARTSTKDKGER
jgi:hypothetical protein